MPESIAGQDAFIFLLIIVTWLHGVAVCRFRLFI